MKVSSFLKDISSCEPVCWKELSRGKAGETKAHTVNFSLT